MVCKRVAVETYARFDPGFILVSYSCGYTAGVPFPRAVLADHDEYRAGIVRARAQETADRWHEGATGHLSAGLEGASGGGGE